jgi:formyl-CoA transferase
MRAAGAFMELDYPGHGTIQTINSPVFVAGSEKRKAVAAPELGAHTREVLRTLGYGDAVIDDMIKRRIAAD